MKFGMKNEPAPKICNVCKRKLTEPKYKQHWTVQCTNCGYVWIWSFPQIWKRIHLLPLWNS